MVTKDTDKNLLLMQAKRLKQYCDLLIQQCDSWLDAPEYTDEYECKLLNCLKSFAKRLFKRKNNNNNNNLN